mmetsp:Transcript_85049/g.134361  ORF Transcript_85049/g.134361 Transcript_85049/m.134361 type:complete len:174 (-) Transcript_85049:182-703(-)
METAATGAASATLSPTLVIVVVLVIVVIGLLAYSMTAKDAANPIIELHPTQVKVVEEWGKKIGSDNKGKGIRVIIDYLRDYHTQGNEEHVNEVLSEPPKYAEGFVPFEVFLYDGQIDFLGHFGYKKTDGEGVERYKSFSKALRAMVDYAMRVNSEGNTKKMEDIFENVRCLNC